jgi:hypothetical protein
MNIPSKGTRKKMVAWSPTKLEKERERLMNLTIDPSTQKSYASALKSYLLFCSIHNLEITPTSNTLSLYIAFMSSHINPKSVTAYLSGISHCLEPSFPEIRQIRQSSIVVRTLRGALRSFGKPVTRKSALTTAHLRDIITRFPPDNQSLDDALFITILLTGFFGLMRLGELVIPDDTAIINPRKIIQRDSVQATSSTYEFTLPAHKVDPFFEGNRIVIRTTSGSCDPRSRFLQYLTIRDRTFPFHSQLFLNHSGSVPSRGWFMHCFRQFLPREFGGQSLRAGGATWLASRGTDHAIIQATGRWASDTWKIYIRQHPLLLLALMKPG